MLTGELRPPCGPCCSGPRGCRSHFRTRLSSFRAPLLGPEDFCWLLAGRPCLPPPLFFLIFVSTFWNLNPDLPSSSTLTHSVWKQEKKRERKPKRSLGGGVRDRTGPGSVQSLLSVHTRRPAGRAGLLQSHDTGTARGENPKPQTHSGHSRAGRSGVKSAGLLSLRTRRRGAAKGKAEVCVLA